MVAKYPMTIPYSHPLRTNDLSSHRPSMVKAITERVAFQLEGSSSPEHSNTKSIITKLTSKVTNIGPDDVIFTTTSVVTLVTLAIAITWSFLKNNTNRTRAFMNTWGGKSPRSKGMKMRVSGKSTG